MVHGHQVYGLSPEQANAVQNAVVEQHLGKARIVGDRGEEVTAAAWMGAGRSIMAGLILEGGGMRAGFVAGAVMALMDSDVTRFDLAVGCSASVPPLSYFATGQRQESDSAEGALPQIRRTM